MADVSRQSSWGWAEGDEIAPGRTVVADLGGGSRYEVALVWDDERFALFVAKALRPHVAEDEDARRDLALDGDGTATAVSPARRLAALCFAALLLAAAPLMWLTSDAVATTAPKGGTEPRLRRRQLRPGRRRRR